MGVALTATCGRRRAADWGRGVRWLLGAMLALTVGAASATVAATTHDPASRWTAVVDPGIPAGSQDVDVVVQARAGASIADLTAVVEAAGGTVTGALPIVDGASVRIPGDRVADVAADGRVLAITLDRDASFESVTYDETGTASAFCSPLADA